MVDAPEGAASDLCHQAVPAKRGYMEPEVTGLKTG